MRGGDTLLIKESTFTLDTRNIFTPQSWCNTDIGEFLGPENFQDSVG